MSEIIEGTATEVQNTPEQEAALRYQREINERFSIVSGLIVRDVNLISARIGPLTSQYQALGLLTEEHDLLKIALRTDNREAQVAALVRVAAVALRTVIDIQPREALDVVELKARSEDARAGKTA